MTRRTRKADRRRQSTCKKTLQVQTPVDPETVWPRQMIGEPAKQPEPAEIILREWSTEG